ncbi:MAG TPA: VWA domain-containing protein [Terriglobales bacterium]|nr:VWA domain-containing protein [Terriglobales bacterium]
MFSMSCIKKPALAAQLCAYLLSFSLTLSLVAGTALISSAQEQSGQNAGDQNNNGQNSGAQQNPNQQETPPEAGGPNNEAGPYAIPKKGEEQPPPPPPERPKKVEGMPDYSIHVDVPLVTVPVMVTTKDGQFISTLKKENFKVFEDGTPQTITDFKVEDAPITAVLLVEFASTTYPLLIDALRASYIFAGTLKKDDWVAVVDYDMKPDILVDFTQDKNAVMQGLNTLRIPGFSETNLFDALYDTLDRLDRVEGHKYIVLVSTGIDTFSKLNLDQITKKVKTTHDVTIFSISIGWMLREYCETHSCTGISHGMASLGIQQIDWYQADNEMQTFARLTGGRFYQPRFEGDFVDTFKDIGEDIRHQYAIAYRPTNTKLDGTYRKLKVELVDGEGKPLKIVDQKHKDVKYQVIAREGYTARHQVD